MEIHYFRLYIYSILVDNLAQCDGILLYLVFMRNNDVKK
jgi:hypothetical protein